MSVPASAEFKEELRDLVETREAVESAESRARLEQKGTRTKVPRKNDREFAQALHREADELYHNGDYETALVLYHRAASVFPRDSTHSMAARRTAATISSWNNPTKALRRILPNVRSELQLAVTLCPESAAIKASKILRKSADPSCVAQVLSYFDNHKDYWRTLPPALPSSFKRTKSRASSRQLNTLASTSLKNLKSAFNSGKMTSSLKLAEQLLRLSHALPDPRDYQVEAYHYLALIHVSLGRHDRAVTAVSRMIRLSKCTGDVHLISRSLTTLGKVHLSFGHLEAASRAWEYLLGDVTGAVPRAWLQHEIGRCHLETGKYRKALEKAIACTHAATEGNSKKWTLHGKLLLGQTLAKLGRFAEALDELNVSARITEEEGDTPMLSYIRDLVDKVARALRETTFDVQNQYASAEHESAKVAGATEELGGPSTIFTQRRDTLITTAFSHGKGLTECYNESSEEEEEEEKEVEEDPDGEITVHCERMGGLMQRSPRERIRSDLAVRVERNDELILPGSSTFRIRSSGSSHDCNFEVRTDILCKEFDDILNQSENGLARSSERTSEEDAMSLRDSATSLNSDDTYLTYVIDHSRREIEMSKMTENRRIRTSCEEKTSMNNKTTGSVERPHEDIKTLPKNSPNERDLGQKHDLLNTLGIIEELDKKNEVELLELLRGMLLPSKAEDRLPEGMINPSDLLPNTSASMRDAIREFGTSRSHEDGQSKVVEKHALFRHSLPPSPRKYDADAVPHPCEGCTESLGST